MAIREWFISGLALLIRISHGDRFLVWAMDRLGFFLFHRKKTAHITFSRERLTNKLAVLAIFQPKGLSEFVKKEVNFLNSLGYDVAFVAPHSLSDTDNRFLEGVCRFIVERPNLGRDFGSYKDGILSVGFDRIAEYERVLLINDSIFFPIGDTDQFVKEFLAATKEFDLVGLAENSTSIRHLSSFFVDSSARLFCSKRVRDYWESYKPYSSRFHSIRAGEMGLSKVLYKEATNIHIMYSPERIVNDIYGHKLDREQLFRLSSDVFFGKIKKSLLSSADVDTPSSRFMIADIFREVMERSSVPHSLGLFLTVLYGMPLLKRDVYYHGVFDLAQVYSALHSRVDDNSLKNILLELRKKGAPRNQSWRETLMIKIGAR